MIRTSHQTEGRRTSNGEADMTYEAINFQKKFGLFQEQWQPKIIAEMNES